MFSYIKLRKKYLIPFNFIGNFELKLCFQQQQMNERELREVDGIDVDGVDVAGLDLGDRQVLEQRYSGCDPPCLLDSSDGR